MAGGVLPTAQQQAEQAFQAVPLPILPSQRPILRQPIAIITGNAGKYY